MTYEQMELDYAHIELDVKLKKKASGEQVYEDEEYDEYDRETEDMDSRLSDAISVKIKAEDDWEDVETDDS